MTGFVGYGAARAHQTAADPDQTAKIGTIPLGTRALLNFQETGMNVSLQVALSDPRVDAQQGTQQRQVAIAIAALPDLAGTTAPLNLCLVLDHSGSMGGTPLDTVKKAATQLVARLAPSDRLSIVAFDHHAKVLVPNQTVGDGVGIKQAIANLQADGGTAIDEGLKLAIEELAKGRENAISQAFLLTDGENEHGDNDRCLQFAQLAADYTITVNTLGFGSHWNQDVLEAIADAGGGTMTYIEFPEQAVGQFGRLFERLQAVGLTNAHLQLSLRPPARLAAVKPIAQVAPDTIELPVTPIANAHSVRLGDLMVDVPRIVLVNLYLDQLPPGNHAIGQVQVQYDDPGRNATGCFSEPLPIAIQSVQPYQPQPNPEVQQHILAIAKYRQTQIAETKLQQGDRAGAATMLQTAAKTALQMGDQGAATVLQKNATQLQAGQDLSAGDRKKTRIVSKTVLQPPTNQ